MIPSDKLIDEKLHNLVYDYAAFLASQYRFQYLHLPPRLPGPDWINMNFN